MHPAWIEIDLGQFKKNISLIRKATYAKKLCIPIKANAYGHGLYPIAQAAVSMGVDYLAVAHLKEAIDLRKASISTPILVLGAIFEEQIPELLAYNVEFTISSAFKAELVLKHCRALKKKCRVHLEVDTGMRRTGMRLSTTTELFLKLKDNEYFDIVGIYSHLATGQHADDLIALEQIKQFSNLRLSPPFVGHSLIFHLANSVGTLNFTEAQLDMVRPALLSFGYLPDNAPPFCDGIAPCFSLKAKVAYFKIVNEGEGISYGHTFIAKKPSRIVTIPVGYGDGFRRALSNRGSVLINKRRYPIVGTVCMDQFMVDVGEDSVYVGDEAVLIGKQGDQEISIKEMAALCDTIPYEILCHFNDRIPRIYKD